MKLQLPMLIRKMPLAATVAATLLVAAAAHANPESGKLVLAGYTDAADGEQLLAGDYAAVIQKLTAHSFNDDQDKVAASTNLCVAYVASGHFNEAHNACDEAITMARFEKHGATLQELRAHDDEVSTAYANRAVLNKLSGK
jgi:predicted signal transduction protein with EAL and GGDEF domain